MTHNRLDARSRRVAAIRVGGALGLALAALATAQTATAQTPSTSIDAVRPAAPPPGARVPGYLTKDQVADSIRFLGPPPEDGSGAKAGDVATYRATRRLEGTPRWALAARDDSVGAAQMVANFSCAVGMPMTPQATPALFHLFTRLVPDSGLAIGPAKDFYKRPRPFIEKGGKVCIVDQERDALGKTWSYPSGHSTYGWLTGLVMAEVAPDHATAILARARSYGESRVVCGVHYESDVQAGRVAASGVFAALQQNPAYLADVEAAKTELAGASASPAPLDATECAVEAEASEKTIW